MRSCRMCNESIVDSFCMFESMGFLSCVRLMHLNGKGELTFPTLLSLRRWTAAAARPRR